MEQPLVLTFDIGTQSVRCLLVRPDGSFADVEQQKYDVPYYSANPGWAEQTPDFYYEQICGEKAMRPEPFSATAGHCRDTDLHSGYRAVSGPEQQTTSGYHFMAG